MNIEELTEDEIEGATITLERGMCFGTCPVYRLTIHGDGVVEYEGKMYVKIKGKREYHIPRDRVISLLKILSRVGFFSIAEEWSEIERVCRVEVTDMPSSTITASISGEMWIVRYNYGMGCRSPRNRKLITLEIVADIIDVLANSDSLVKI